MLKRTKSYLLCTLLVLTGFAGSIQNGTISAKERRALISDLKESRKDLQLVEELSKDQLQFKASAAELSINDHLRHISAAQQHFENLAHQALTQPPKRLGVSQISDNDFAKLISSHDLVLNHLLATRSPSRKNELAHIRQKQAKLIKFVNTTTDNLHHHFVPRSGGDISSYHALSMLCSAQKHCLNEIERLQSLPGFPRQ